MDDLRGSSWVCVAGRLRAGGGGGGGSDSDEDTLVCLEAEDEPPPACRETAAATADENQPAITADDLLHIVFCKFCSNPIVARLVHAATWTVLHHDGPNHLGL